MTFYTQLFQSFINKQKCGDNVPAVSSPPSRTRLVISNKGSRFDDVRSIFLCFYLFNVLFWSIFYIKWNNCSEKLHPNIICYIVIYYVFCCANLNWFLLFFFCVSTEQRWNTHRTQLLFIKWFLAHLLRNPQLQNNDGTVKFYTHIH